MLEDLVIPQTFRPCKVRTIKEELDTADKTRLEDAVSSPEWPLKTLEKALAAKGIRLSESVIRKHRMKSCGCYER